MQPRAFLSTRVSNVERQRRGMAYCTEAVDRLASSVMILEARMSRVYGISALRGGELGHVDVQSSLLLLREGGGGGAPGDGWRDGERGA